VLFELASGLLRANLYQTSTFDPLTLAMVPTLLFAVAILAAYWPARRAMQLDPMQVLRNEWPSID
jgi:putative ABC transport system permease protein